MIYYCAGKYCPGLQWPASNTPHPTSCVHRHLADRDVVRVVEMNYSELEARVLARMESMVREESDDFFARHAHIPGTDLHALRAAEVFGVPVEEVTEEQRRAATAINFRAVYGGYRLGMSEKLQVVRALENAT